MLRVMRVDENERYEMTDGPNERAYHEARRLSADRNQPRLARLVVSTVGWAVSYVFWLMDHYAGAAESPQCAHYQQWQYLHRHHKSPSTAVAHLYCAKAAKAPRSACCGN